MGANSLDTMPSIPHWNSTPSQKKLNILSYHSYQPVTELHNAYFHSCWFGHRELYSLLVFIIFTGSIFHVAWRHLVPSPYNLITYWSSSWVSLWSRLVYIRTLNQWAQWSDYMAALITAILKMQKKTHRRYRPVVLTFNPGLERKKDLIQSSAQNSLILYPSITISTFTVHLENTTKILGLFNINLDFFSLTSRNTHFDANSGNSRCLLSGLFLYAISPYTAFRLQLLARFITSQSPLMWLP